MVVEIAIDDIEIGVRRRKALGRLQTLMRSIEQHGLIHPIVVRAKPDGQGYQLVAGHRRLEACRRLGSQTIPAAVDNLSDDELRAIEFDENAEREALTDFESSKARLAEIRQAEADAKTCLHSKRVSGKRGPSRHAGSRRDVAEVTGISPAGQIKIERHVELAEQYPVMQRPGWVQHNVLEAGAVLEKLPETDRAAAAALVDQDAVPPKTAIGILENLAKMPKPERQAVFKQAQSDDEFERRTALTKAAALPPPPDPGIVLLGEAEAILRRAAKHCRIASVKTELEALWAAAMALLARCDDIPDGKEEHVA